ncbi:MAG TPA: hypothetical protein VGW76_03365 [Pyrinomonadaceae bacterium]|nr:hypothetical protein [Pyrinomonadaceae bacterium]
MSEESSTPRTVSHAASAKRRRFRLLELSLFLFVWSVYGAAINSANLDAFNLQQAGIEAMVERRQFSLEGSATPQFHIKVYYYDDGRPFGDTFMHNGRQYAAKQPGQFIAGAIVYFFLRLFGLSYLKNYTLTSALVSFFTSSLATAVAALAVFRVVRLFTSGKSLSWPFASAILYAFGTTAFAYSGFAYHDTLASAYLVIAFYLIVILARQQVSERNAPLVAGAAGLLLGITITTSMLPFFMVCVAGVFLLSIWRWKLAVAAITGALVGLVPMFIYNARSFGNPLLSPNLAGDYPETFLHLNLQNSISKAGLYTSEITLYDPIVWCGILGLVFFPRALRRERLVIVGLFIAQAFQVLNIDTHGGCHYGPRFLLPALPFAAIGLAGFHYLRGKTMRRATMIAVALVGVAGIVINFVGAVYGAMYCEVQVFGFWPGLAALQGGGLKSLPLAEWLALPFLLSLLLLAYSIYRQRGISQAP